MLIENDRNKLDRVVGRAELKLAEAARAFGYDFRGKTVLDIGSSTGGFTELALKKGAAKVIAVEKGTRQMKAPLRFDPKVELYEKTDFLKVRGQDKAGKLIVEQEDTSGKGTREQGGRPENSVAEQMKGRDEPAQRMKGRDEPAQRIPVQTVVADVSFISLTKILAHARKILTPKAEYLVMLKPQFEARPEQLVKGVVKNERMRREIMQRFEHWLAAHDFVILKKRDNELVGKSGNRERFYLLKPAQKRRGKLDF